MTDKNEILLHNFILLTEYYNKFQMNWSAVDVWILNSVVKDYMIHKIYHSGKITENILEFLTAEIIL